MTVALRDKMMNDCQFKDNCEGSKPFFVGSNPNFRGARFGYLPPLCYDCIDYRPLAKTNEEKDIYTIDRKPIKVEHIYHHINTQTPIINYLESKVKELLSLQEKLESHIQSSTDKKKRYTKYA